MNNIEYFMVIVNRMGRSVVQVAAQAGAVRVLEFLRDECSVEVGEGGTLHCAAREGQTAMVERLISWGVEVDKRWVVVVMIMSDKCVHAGMVREEHHCS